MDSDIIMENVDFETAARQAFMKLGIEHPKEQQLAAVRALVVGRQNVFVQLPTGFGKSACFQVLPLIYDLLAKSPKRHMVLVITPFSPSSTTRWPPCRSSESVPVPGQTATLT